jgi:hypothetical protein
MSFEEPIVVEIPFEIRNVRIAPGLQQEDVLAFVDLWVVRYADGQIAHISNPLNDVALKGNVETTPPTKIYFKLVPANRPNPGENDNFQSQTYDHWRIS